MELGFTPVRQLVVHFYGNCKERNILLQKLGHETELYLLVYLLLLTPVVFNVTPIPVVIFGFVLFNR